MHASLSVWVCSWWHSSQPIKPQPVCICLQDRNLPDPSPALHNQSIPWAKISPEERYQEWIRSQIEKEGGKNDISMMIAYTLLKWIEKRYSGNWFLANRSLIDVGEKKKKKRVIFKKPCSTNTTTQLHSERLSVTHEESTATALSCCTN